MNKLNKFIYLLGLLMIILIGCSDADDELTDINYDRLFSPTEVAAKIVNKTNIRLSWNAVNKADSYNIEVFANGDMSFDGTPALILTGITERPYTIEGLEGEVDYSVRIQAASASIPSSKWVGIVGGKTDPEQIFKPVAEDDVTLTGVTLRWTTGETATEIILEPTNIKHTVTASEIAAGAATITGLTHGTKYKATLMNGTKVRGTIEFETKVDGITIRPGDGVDLKAIFDAAEEGASFVLYPGEYKLGSYTITKSIKISGLKSSDKPIVEGQFDCGSTVSSIELKSLIFTGNETTTAFFTAQTGCDLSLLSIEDCDISNYGNALIYNNVSGKFGDVKILNSLVHDIQGSGGDGIDFRGGTLGSLTVSNSTFYNGFRTFLRMQATCGPVSFTNCTFYKIANFDNSNNHGIFRITAGDTFTVSNCLFVETGNATSSIATAGNFCRQASNMKVTTTSYSKNIYYSCYKLWVGLYTNPSDCGAKEGNPQFTDAANGNFTVNNIDVDAGDPRWLN